MAKIPIDTRLMIEIAIEDREFKSELRPYLGMSSIGDSCARKLWYGFRWCARENLSARKTRLFSRGHREEPIVIADLESQGVIVHSDQLECTACCGHVRGHCDGHCDNLPDAPKTTHLLEIKTANDKNFRALVKQGLAKKFPVYHSQMQCYMRAYSLKRGLFIAVNKNNDERYYERVYINKPIADELIIRASGIIVSFGPPKRIGTSTWFECKWCKFYDICHFGDSVLKTCRTCQHAILIDGGKWGCVEHDIELLEKQQLEVCPDRLELKTLAGDV